MSEFNETVYRIASEFFSKIPEELKEENKGQQEGDYHIAMFKSLTAKLRSEVWCFEKVRAEEEKQP